MHLLLLPKCTHTSPNDYLGLPLNFQIVTKHVLITGYQLYAVEKWIVERNRAVSLLVVYTGDSAHTVTLTALAPVPHLSESESLDQWNQAIFHLRADGAKPKQTANGVLMVTSLAHFRSDFTIVHIPGGDFLAIKDQLYTNINLLRIGCSGRSALTLDDPSDTTKDRFIAMYSLPETCQAQQPPPPISSEHLPLPPSLIHSQSNFQQVGRGRPVRSPNRSTSSLPTKKDLFHGKTKERFIFIATVLELVKLIQAGLAIFGMYGAASPSLIFDGLLCDVTVDGIGQWIAKIGGPCVSLEPTERIADPMFVSALLSLILSIRNKLAHLGYSNGLPKDPFLHPYTFSLALTNYIQTCSPPAILSATQTTQPDAHTTSSNYIPTPANLLSTAAAAAPHTRAILTRELVESINNTYDLKIKHESRKVRRAIKNKRGTAESSDGEQQCQHRGGEKINMSAGEDPRDVSPVKGGVVSSGGQILSGIGSLASGLRLGAGAVGGDVGCIVNPMVDLTTFINCVKGNGSHKDSIRKVKEKKKDSVDLGPMIGISAGKEKDGVVGGSLKLLWSGRVTDIVRIREMDVDSSSAGGSNERDKEKERDRDRSKKKHLVASDGELDDLMGKEKSTEEESDNVSVIPGHGHANSFGGIWSGRVKGKLGHWTGLARKKHQSVDLTTPSRASSVIKQKDPSTPQNQHTRSLGKLVIGGGGGSHRGVSMRQQASSHGCEAQSPTLPPMISSLEGDGYAEDDDLLSSGQVSPLSDYRASPFKLRSTTNNLTWSEPARISTTNLSAAQALNSQDYEHVLSKLLNNKKKETFGLSRTSRDGRGQEEKEGEGEMDSDISELRRNGSGRWKRKEKARFHSLLSVVDGKGVESEKELEGDSDYEEEEEWEEKGGRKSLFEPRRRRSFHDLEAFKGVGVLAVDRMMVDVEICGQLLIALRREEHLANVGVCIKLLADSLSMANHHLREHYESHMDTMCELESRLRVLTELDCENVKVEERFQATNALRYESEQFVMSELWDAARASRHKVFELRDKVFGTEGVQWSVDGKKRKVDQLGRTESEAEEERNEGEEEEAEPERHWLLRFLSDYYINM